MGVRLLATGQSAAAASSVTLDGAYDRGGAGVGRTITVDSGAVRLIVPDGSSNIAALELDYRESSGTAMDILVGAATTLDGFLEGISINFLTNLTPGSQPVTGLIMNLPGNDNISTRGLRIDTRMQQGIIFQGQYAGATTLSAATIGLDLNLALNVTGGARNITPIRLAIATTTGTHFALDVEDQNAGAEGARMRFFHNSGSPADADILLMIQVDGNSDNPTRRTYGSIRLLATDVSDGTEDSQWDFHGMAAGSDNLAMTLLGDGDLSVDLDSSAGGVAVVGIFDDFDDVAVVDSVLHDRERGLDALEEMGIVTRSHAGNRMLSLKKAIGLAYGGIVQSHQRMLDLVQDLQSRLLVLEGGSS